MPEAEPDQPREPRVSSYSRQDVLRILQISSRQLQGWEKAGLIEVADLIVVNKSDLPGADRVRQQLLGALTLTGSKTVPVLNVTAASGAGVVELWDAIQAHFSP